MALFSIAQSFFAAAALSRQRGRGKIDDLAGARTFQSAATFGNPRHATFSNPKPSNIAADWKVRAPACLPAQLDSARASSRKRQRTAALQDASRGWLRVVHPAGLGVRLSFAAFSTSNRTPVRCSRPSHNPRLGFGIWDFFVHPPQYLSIGQRALKTLKRHTILAAKFVCYGGRGIWILGFGIFCSPLLSRAQDKITYQDHILPLVEANCSKCHNADKKKADLELTSYQGILKGSGSGPVVLSGSADGSKLWKALTHSEEPYMPPNRAKLDDKELDLFKKWIAGGLLENAGGKAVAAAGPGVDLTIKADAVGKPDGPPPMPKDLPIEPVIHTARMNAITGLASSPWAPLVAVAGQKQVLLYNSESLSLLGVLPFNDSAASEPASKD